MFRTKMKSRRSLSLGATKRLWQQNALRLVTKILTTNGSEFHSAEAKIAIDTEITKFVIAGVWDVMPVSKAWGERKHKDASFSSIFGFFESKMLNLVLLNINIESYFKVLMSKMLVIIMYTLLILPQLLLI